MPLMSQLQALNRVRSILYQLLALVFLALVGMLYKLTMDSSKLALDTGSCNMAAPPLCYKRPSYGDCLEVNIHSQPEIKEHHLHFVGGLPLP